MDQLIGAETDLDGFEALQGVDDLIGGGGLLMLHVLGRNMHPVVLGAFEHCGEHWSSPDSAK